MQCKKVVLIMLMSVQMPSVCKGLLHSLFEYAQSIPEEPDLTAASLFKPGYEAFYNERTTSFGYRMARLFRFGTHFFTKEAYIQVLKEVTQQRELDGMVGAFVQKKRIEQASLWYVWGPIHGSFHALVRALDDMFRLGLIDEDLYIIRAHHYMVFCGDALSSSAYGLDTLYLLLLLMQRNPNNIYYLKGPDEEQWQQSTLKKELMVRFSESEREQWHLFAQIDRFLHTLPLGLFLEAVTGQLFTMSNAAYTPRLETAALHKQFDGALSDQMMALSESVQEERSWRIKAMIEGVEPTSDEQNTDFEQLVFQEESTRFIWRLFSTAMGPLKKRLGLTHDAVIELRAFREFGEWRLSLFKEDMVTQKGFRKELEFNVATGQELFVGDSHRYLQKLKERVRRIKAYQERLIKQCRQPLKTTGIRRWPSIRIYS